MDSKGASWTKAGSFQTGEHQENWSPSTLKIKDQVLFSEFECKGKEKSLLDCSYKRVDECPY